MLSSETKDNVEEILKNISIGQEISLNERILIHKLAHQDQTISASLIKAQRMNQKSVSNDKIDSLLNDLALGPADPQSEFKKGQDDLGDWFSGAPSWLARS